MEGLGFGFAEKGWRLSDGPSLWAWIAQSLRVVLDGFTRKLRLSRARRDVSRRRSGFES